MIKYNDRVRINAGFYVGVEGNVIESTQCYEAGAGVGYLSYKVKLDIGKEILSDNRYLDKIEI